ncbi:hypothetical protein SAMN04487785_107140 [Dyella jiangningensis]|uniref:PDZ domain-containing protein n=1 Tax=Dyella sp. AtDHG13 TaxID=1938897 RepID=UPI0008806C9D|nr:PDZ domain-containing protein [Dyella sp. AtDHG13]PXV57325.1 hypothetical protein BDW41_107154 [Dyella sp. AtDHG13]SDK40091.1 hypothetical protein SAMN04487785_107140 [Dyella jiangningensis]
MKSLSLLMSGLVAMAALPALAQTAEPGPDGHLTYSGNFLTVKDGTRQLKLTTDGHQRVFVDSVTPQGWMGLHSTDQIERINGQPIRWVGQLVDQLQKQQPEPVVLTVYHHDIDMRVYEKRELTLAQADYARLIPIAKAD